MKSKKAYYFTMDALIALMIIFGVLFTIKIIPQETKLDTNTQDDLIKVMSSIKMNEINNSYVNTLEDEGNISGNNTLLEQIAEFYAKGKPEAEPLTENILFNLEPENNMGVWFEDELIASQNSSPYSESKEIYVSEQMISGIEKGNVTGYSSKAYLRQSNSVRYYYFGGYIGDGNISLRLDYEGELKDIDLEIAINKEFDLKINGVNSGHYEKSPSDTTPAKYDLDSYTEYFSSGNNTIEFLGDQLYIAGGYLKLTYEKETFYNETQKHYLPGIEGLVNIYDGLNFPENMSSMEMLLHLNSSHDTFVRIGDKVVYEGNTTKEERIKLNNSYLSETLDYNSLKGKTVPFRFGMKNISHLGNQTGTGDVFSVTDLSGSMCGTCSEEGSDCCTSWFLDICNNDQPQCEDCGGICEDMIYNAKDANDVFIDSILNVSGNRIGLVGYESDVENSDVHEISADNQSLHDQVDEWKAVGGTCICCGINEAADRLAALPEDRERAMVVMSDGQANYECSEQGTGSATEDAIQAACDAYNNHNITVHSVGFGSGADESTLQDIADCGNGNYYFGTVDNIVELYQNISKDVINATYKKQTVEYEEGFKIKSWPDSYVEFGMEQKKLPYGLIISTESPTFNSSSKTNFKIPANSTPLEAHATSYSGDKWTTLLNLKNQTWKNLFNLTSYNSDYTKLGDPFVFQIPVKNITKGKNPVELKTGLSEGNFSNCSLSNKVIYKILKKALAYSPIKASAKGCEWAIEFDDESIINTSIPSNYSGDETCEYTSNEISYNSNDAIDYSVYSLLKELDINLDGRIDTKFNEESLNITPNKIEGIPYTYKSKMQVRVWR